MSGKGSAVRAGRAFVELYADGTKLARGLKQARDRLKAWGATVQGVGNKIFAAGAALAGPLAAAAKAFSDAGSDLADMSQRTGASVEALSELGFAANQSGADLETLENGLKKMQKKLADAAGGSAEANAALQRLGLSSAALKDLAPDAQFAALADRIASIADPAQRTAAAMDVFGKAGTQLLPLLNEGSQGIEQLREEARALGISMSTEDATAAEAFGDDLSRLWQTMKSGLFRVGAALAPVLSELVQQFTVGAAAVSKWVNENRPAIVAGLKLAGALLAGGAALIGVGVVLKGFGLVVGGIGSAIAIALAVAKVAFAGLAAAVMFLASPIGLVVAAVVGLGAVTVAQSGVMQTTLDGLPGLWSDLKNTATTAWGAIGKALASGNLAAAANVAWTGLKLVWAQATVFLMERWTEFTTFLKEVLNQSWSNTSGFLINSIAAISAGWTETVDFMGDVWSMFTAGLSKAWNSTVGFIKRAWVRLKGFFSSDVDVDAEVQRINAETEGKNNAADDERNKKILGREEERKQKLAQIEKDRQGALEANEDIRNGRTKDNQAAAKQRIDDLKKGLADAQQEFQGAVSEAEASPPAAPQVNAQQAGGKDRQRPSFAEPLRNTSSAGTFSAAAVGGLGISGQAQKMVAYLAQIEKHTKDGADASKQGEFE